MSPRAFFAAILVALFQIIDPATSDALICIGQAVVDAFSSVSGALAATLSAHPFDAIMLGTALAIEPLAVPTRVAWHLMGISNAHGYKLIEQNEINSYLEGRVRKVTVASIKAYIARKLAAAKKDATPARTEKATAASVARRAERKAAKGAARRGKRRKPAPIIATPAPRTDLEPHPEA